MLWKEKIMIEFLTLVLVVITGYYAWATRHILKANQNVVNLMADQQEAILRPYIAISQFCPPNDPSFYLKISNLGKTPARNLKITPNKDYINLADRVPSLKLHEFPAFTQVIENFPPGAEIIFYLGHCSTIFGKETEEEIKSSKIGFKLEYFFANKKNSETTTLDFRQYFHSDVTEDPYCKNLSKIDESIKKCSKSISQAIISKK